MGQWLEHLPVPAALPNVDKVAAAAGKVLFEDPVVACASCHSGPHLTNNQTLDVGTGGAFQVPSLLGVSARLPLMHDGCAATLADRFTKCGGDKHGQTDQLSQGQIAELVAYLGTL
jgi:cytochrome c peroxidase